MNASIPHGPPGGAPAMPSIQTEADSADLFVATLPSTSLKLASLGWLVSGVLLLFLAFRLLLSVRQNPTGAALEGAHVFLGLMSFAVVWGLVRGHRALSVAGLLVAPGVGALSLFALLTGSIAGLLGMSLSCFDVVMTAVTMTEVGRIGRARKALRRSFLGG
jgi:hypothetical protein